MHGTFLAATWAFASAGSNSAARMAMIAMTTSNSIRVKAEPGRRRAAPRRTSFGSFITHSRSAERNDHVLTWRRATWQVCVLLHTRPCFHGHSRSDEFAPAGSAGPLAVHAAHSGATCDLIGHAPVIRSARYCAAGTSQARCPFLGFELSPNCHPQTSFPLPLSRPFRMLRAVAERPVSDV